MVNTVKNVHNKRFDIDSFKMKDTKVLIIDNDDISNNAILKMLNKVEAEGVCAVDIQCAISEINKKDYDIIIIGNIFENESFNEGFSENFNEKKSYQIFLEKIKDISNEITVIGIDASPTDEFRRIINNIGGELILLKTLKFEQLALIFRNELLEKVV